MLTPNLCRFTRPDFQSGPIDTSISPNLRPHGCLPHFRHCLSDLQPLDPLLTLRSFLTWIVFSLICPYLIINFTSIVFGITIILWLHSHICPLSVHSEIFNYAVFYSLITVDFNTVVQTLLGAPHWYQVYDPIS